MEEFDKKKELIRNVIIAGSNAIPTAGGFISVILDKYLPNEIEKRKSELLLQLQKDLEELPENLIKKLENNSEFYTIFIKVLRSAIEEHREEKICAFRNILVNVILNEQSEEMFDEQTMYVKLVTFLTVDQIRILRFFYMRDYKKTIIFEDNNIYSYLTSTWNHVDKAYIVPLITELIRYNIIASSVEVTTKKGKGHQLSTFGERFIEYIFKPHQYSELPIL